MPVRVDDWGLAGSESVIVKAADRGPLARGYNLTRTVQVAPPARLFPQVLLMSRKSPALVPVMATLLMLTAAEP